MLIYPQLVSGASVQYPITRQVSQRSIRSAMEDGTVITMADQGSNYLSWRVLYRDLSNQEAAALISFFAATQGELQPFLFFDPTANLLQWSGDFSQSAWQTAGLRFDSAVADPIGGTQAVRANNNGSADVTIAQTTQIPGSPQVCFSVYLRTSAPVASTLARTAGSQSQTEPVNVTTVWQRFCLSGYMANVSDSSQFAIAVPAGAALEIYGPQVDAQVNPSTYVASSASSGVYANARFDMKQLTVVATGPNRNSCAVGIRCNLPGGE
jgi:hypothetical protein